MRDTGYECEKCGYEPTQEELNGGTCPQCRLARQKMRHGPNRSRTPKRPAESCPKTIQQAEQEALTAMRAWVPIHAAYTAACDKERDEGRWPDGERADIDVLSEAWRDASRASNKARYALEDAAKALAEADAANPIAKVGSDPTYRYGKGAPCVDELERDAAAREG